MNLVTKGGGGYYAYRTSGASQVLRKDMIIVLGASQPLFHNSYRDFNSQIQAQYYNSRSREYLLSRRAQRDNNFHNYWKYTQGYCQE